MKEKKIFLRLIPEERVKPHAACYLGTFMSKNSCQNSVPNNTVCSDIKSKKKKN